MGGKGGQGGGGGGGLGTGRGGGEGGCGSLGGTGGSSSSTTTLPTRARVDGTHVSSSLGRGLVLTQSANSCTISSVEVKRQEIREE